LEAASSTHNGDSIPRHLESLRAETHGSVPSQDSRRRIECHWHVTATRDGQRGGAGQQSGGKDNVRKKISSIRRP
jgi:hypothetical protein